MIKRLILALDETWYLVTACHMVGVSRSVAVAAIRNLEAEVGQIFYRQGYSRLTDKGKELVRQWREEARHEAN